MRNELQGLDLVHNRIWECREITEEGGSKLWLGTGVDLPGFVLHVDLRSALTFYISQYPMTDTITAVLANQYRMSIPSRAAAVTIIDVILKDLEAT